MAKAAAPAVAHELAHMKLAKSLLGLKEVAGGADNPTIMGWAKALKVTSVYIHDSVPWCGLFAAHVLAKGAPGSKLPVNFLGARNWKVYGTPTVPQYGAVLVFWRDREDGPFGHVGFYVGEDEAHYHVLGGNQTDSVSIARVPKARLLSARWVPTVPVPEKPVVVKLDKDGAPVSTTEA